MYTLKGISFVASASLFDILLFNFFVVGGAFLCRKKQKTKRQKKDGWMDEEFKNETQEERKCVSFFNRSIEEFFFVCKALCVCVLDFVDFWYGFYISRRRRAFHQKM
tara:strand:+ start:109 stop:429 length:321 start_codon:yes stop_codon:yes gene_type:complete